MNKIVTIIINVCRALLALTFIFSGYVKAIDPLGTQYKINDYLTALSMADTLPGWVTLAVSVLLAALEFSMGVFMLCAIRRRLTTRVTLIFMTIMTLITVWIAVANPVKDCGCFGDAVVLTNGQTLAKNIVLLACSVMVCCYPQRMFRFVSESNQWIAVNFTILYIIATSLYSLYTLPQFDFRPYHIGANIRQGMTVPPGAKLPQYDTTFIMEKNGVRREFTLANYPDSTWTFVDRRTVQTSEGYVPPIHDFAIQDNRTGDDITQQVLSDPGYTFLLIAPHLETADDSNFGDIDQLYEYSQSQHVPFYCLTASGDEGIQRWRDITGAEYPFCTSDETTLKTIIRSNPGLVLLKDGVVIGKWSHNRLPQASELTAPLDRLDIGHLPSASYTPRKILAILLWFVLPLGLLILADRTWAWSRWLRNQEKEQKSKYFNFKNKKQ